MGKSITRAVVIEPDAGRADTFIEGLGEAGIRDVTVHQGTDNLASLIAALDPHVILIDLAGLQRGMAEQMVCFSQHVRCPVVIFADESDPALIRRAVQAGVSGYVVDGLQKERLGPVIEVAMARFGQLKAVADRVERLEQELKDRKVIDRAKGILMDARSFSEDEAHAFLRRTAMNQKKKMGDIAALIVDANKLGF